MCLPEDCGPGEKPMEEFIMLSSIGWPEGGLEAYYWVILPLAEVFGIYALEAEMSGFQGNCCKESLNNLPETSELGG